MYLGVIVAEKSIFRQRQFGSLFWTQFFGALNDNFFKNALVMMITYKGVTLNGMSSESLVPLASALFILPFFLFSPLAGQLADKFEKTKLVRFTKVWEFAIMLVGVIGFFSENYWLLLGVLFLLGVQSTFFGPVKYSILPQILPTDRLVQGNALIELGTFLAILFGMIGGVLVTGSSNLPLVATAVMLAVAGLGVWTSYKMQPVHVGNPSLEIKVNPIPSFIESWKLIREQQAVFNSVLAISWFWFYSTGMVSILPMYCKNTLGVNEQVATAFLVMFTVGVAAGSILCEKLSFHRVEIGLVPLGSLGMTIFLADLFFIFPPWTPGNELMGLREFLSYGASYRMLFDFMMTSMFGGIFIVPLYALIQQRSHEESRSRVIAANNIMNAVFMVASSLVLIAFAKIHLTLPQMFLALAGLNFLASLYIYSVVPEFTLRFLAWVAARCLYKMNVKGEQNIPTSGPVVLVCNHVTFIDWLLVMASVKRPARFVMYFKFFTVPIVRHFMKQAKVIPIAARKEDQSLLDAAYERISKELRYGEVVCIFPEGQITYDGKLQPLKPGVLRILEKDPVTVVPMAINHLFDSLFSRKHGAPFRNLPRNLWRPIELNIGKPIPPGQANLENIEAAIRALLDPPEKKGEAEPPPDDTSSKSQVS